MYQALSNKQDVSVGRSSANMSDYKSPEPHSNDELVALAHHMHHMPRSLLLKQYLTANGDNVRFASMLDLKSTS
jgi:hypothetical protein